MVNWNLGLEIEKRGELGRASELIQASANYLRELGHPYAEKFAAHVAALHARIAGESSVTVPLPEQPQLPPPAGGTQPSRVRERLVEPILAPAPLEGGADQVHPGH